MECCLSTVVVVGRRETDRSDSGSCKASSNGREHRGRSIIPDSQRIARRESVLNSKHSIHSMTARVDKIASSVGHARRPRWPSFPLVTPQASQCTARPTHKHARAKNLPSNDYDVHDYVRTYTHTYTRARQLGLGGIGLHLLSNPRANSVQ